MIFREQERIHFNENTIRLINPDNVLKRGYTITLKEGKIIKSTKQINVSEEIETRFADGTVKSNIVKKDSYEQ
jgi:exodeoxyribonuclease VII large subunit